MPHANQPEPARRLGSWTVDRDGPSLGIELKVGVAISLRSKSGNSCQHPATRLKPARGMKPKVCLPTHPRMLIRVRSLREVGNFLGERGSRTVRQEEGFSHAICECKSAAL